MEIESAFGRTDLGGETFNVFDGFLENEAVWDSALGDEDRLLSCIVHGIDQHTARLSAPGSTESHDIDIDTVDWDAIYSAQDLESPIISPRYSLQLSSSPSGTTASPPAFRLPWQQTRQATATATLPPPPRARFSIPGTTHSQDRAFPALAAACNGGRGIVSASSASVHGEASLCEHDCPPSATAMAAWQSTSTLHPSLVLAPHHAASWSLVKISVAPHTDVITSTSAIPIAAAAAAIASDDGGRGSSDENGSGGCGGSVGAASPAATPAPAFRPAPIQVPDGVASLDHPTAAAPAAPPSTFPTPGACSSATASIAMAATTPAVEDGMGVCHSSCADTAATALVTGPLPLLPSRDSGSTAASATPACVIPLPLPPPQPSAATATAAAAAASPEKACDTRPHELVPVLSQSSACGAAADFSDGSSRTAVVDQSSPRPASLPQQSPAGGPYTGAPMQPNFAPLPLPESLPSPTPGTHARQLARAAAAIAAAAMLRQPPPDLEVMGLLPPGFSQSRLPVLPFSKATTMTPCQQQQRYQGVEKSCGSSGCCDGGCGCNAGGAAASWNPVCNGCAYRRGSGGCRYMEGPNRGWQQLPQRQHPYRRVQCGNGYFAGSSVHTPATPPYQRPHCIVPGTGYCYSCPTAAAPSSQPQQRYLAVSAPARYTGHGDDTVAPVPAPPVQELSPSCASNGGGRDGSGGAGQQHGGQLQGSGGGQAQGSTYGLLRVVKGASGMEVDDPEAVLRGDRPMADIVGMFAAARSSSNGGGCTPNGVPRLDATAEVDDNEADLQLLQELLHAPKSGGCGANAAMSAGGVPFRSLAGSAAPPMPHAIWFTPPWGDRPIVRSPAQSYAAPRSDNTRSVAMLRTPPQPPYLSPCPSLYGRDTQIVQGPSTYGLPSSRTQARGQQLEWNLGSRPHSATGPPAVAPPVVCSPDPDPSDSRCFCPECRRKYASGGACIPGQMPKGAATPSPAPPPLPPAPTYPPPLPPCPSTSHTSVPSPLPHMALHSAGTAMRCTLPCCNPSLAAAPPPPPPLPRPQPPFAEASPWTQSRCVLPCCNPAAQHLWEGNRQGSGPDCNPPLPTRLRTQSELQSSPPPAPPPLHPAARRALSFPPVNSIMTPMAMTVPAADSGLQGVHVGALASVAVTFPPGSQPQPRPDINLPQVQQLHQSGSRPINILGPSQPSSADIFPHTYPHLHPQYQYQQQHHHHGGMKTAYTGSSLPNSRYGAVLCNECDSGGNGGGSAHYFRLPLPSGTAAPAASACVDRMQSPSSSYTSPAKLLKSHLEAPPAGVGHWGSAPLTPRPVAAGVPAAAGGLVEGVRCIASPPPQPPPAIETRIGAAPVALPPQPAALSSVSFALYNGGVPTPGRMDCPAAQAQQQQRERPNVQQHIALLPNSRD